ncbi:hypothetical protein EBI_25639 [Enterocytozoon bieneusi H348]|nr:hypothetical protein EBI_25639 [Enterocytozoon bieneusi H348]|eukprot:XP_002651321.1 hypothetical protein EBI_25639 [Enterocytozoon bieneusi H348]
MGCISIKTKYPKKVLLVGNIVGQILPPVPDIQIDNQCGNTHYDLIVYVDLYSNWTSNIQYPFRMLKYVRRRTSINQYVFQKALAHYKSGNTVGENKPLMQKTQISKKNSKASKNI